MKTRADIYGKSIEAGLSEELSEEMANAAIRCLFMKLHSANGPISVGCSKVGGYPDLPPDIEWPCSGPIKEGEPRRYTDNQYEVGPLRFIAQINLSELPFVPEGLPFTAHGMLLFFAATQKTDLPFTDCEGEDWKVIYLDNIKDLRPRLEVPYLSSAFIEASSAFSSTEFDDIESFLVSEHAIEWSEDFSPKRTMIVDPHVEASANLLSHRAHEHLMGGYAFSIQSPPEETAAAFAKYKSRTGVGMRRWLLLAQFDSEDSCRLLWHGEGRAFFMIPEGADARNAVLECILVTQQA